MKWSTSTELPPCPTINIPLIVPVGEQRIVLGRLWNSIPHNAPFTAGKYYTALSFDLELGGMSRRHDLKLEFEVY